MKRTSFLAGGLFLVASIVSASPTPQNNCPACYTHTTEVDRITSPCPKPPHLACGVVCDREARAARLRHADDEDRHPPQTYTHLVLVTASTVVSTIPGPNPGCPSTATVTRTGLTEDIVCGHLRPAHCGCAAEESTVTVQRTVSRTATQYVTGAALTCAVVAGETPDRTTAAATGTCATAYTTVQERRYCPGSGRERRASVSLSPAQSRPTDATEVVTRGCTEIQILGSRCTSGV